MSVEPFENVNLNAGYRWKSAAAQVTSELGIFIRSLGLALETRKRQRIDRDAFNNILTLDDRSLADIGVSREDVKWASSLPLSANAALELKILRSKVRKQ